MPNISIKEINRTSAGTPGEYGNITVLITGYRGTPVSGKGNVIPADFNGAYEFTSQGDFLATIGEAPVEKINENGEKELHYGNKMAKYLLGLGYPVIYKVINSIQEMNSASFWADFKDKANYDFRFISHGLLETCYDVGEHTKLYNELKILEQDAKKFAEILANVTRLNAEEAIKKEADPDYTVIEYTAEKEYYRVIAQLGQEFSGATSDPKYYMGKGEGYTGFKDPRTGIAYGAWSTVYTAFNKVGDETLVISDKLDEIDEHNAQHVTPEVFRGINGYIAQLASYIVNETTGEPDSTSNGRGDCVALIELDEDEYCERVSTSKPEVLIAEGISKMVSFIGANGKYCAMTVPSVYCKMGGEEPEKLPGAFYYLACFMNSLKSGFAEWYAAAGYTRGVSTCPIDHTSVRLGEIAINALEPRDNKSGLNFACNVIANFRGSYYLWGNRTAATLKDNLTADHFLNIRQLCSTIKKQLYVSCRRFTFDPNSDTLWYNFVNAITPTLERMKADQGIRDYKVIKVYTDKKATLKAKIRLIPIEAVEDFDIEISLEDNFGGTSVVANG